MKFKVFGDYMHIYALGEIIWKKRIADKFQIGLKIRSIDQESRNMKLDFPFSLWLKNLHEKT